MEKQKPTKQTKLTTKKKPLKVVYISNPMKVNADVSDFRALVQQLTGQDSVFPDPTAGGALHYPSPRETKPTKQLSNESPSGSRSGSGSTRSDSSIEDGYEDVYMPELLDNLPGILSSNWWNE